MDTTKLLTNILQWLIIIGFGYLIIRYKVIPKFKENGSIRNRNGKEQESGKMGE